MKLGSDRVQVGGVSQHPWEQAGVELLLESLPDRDPFQLWYLVELYDPSGRLHEIDAVVLAPRGMFLIELKGHPGRFTNEGPQDWVHTWKTGERKTLENPVRATNFKAKVLGNMLGRELGPGVRRPWVEPLVLLSDPGVENALTGQAAMKVVTRGGLMGALTRGDHHGASPALRTECVDRVTMRRVVKAMRRLGFVRSKGRMKVGELVLKETLESGPDYQDRVGHHEQLDRLRRVRCYTLPRSSRDADRASLKHEASREAELLNTVGDHPSILRLVDFRPEGPLAGPCLVFEHLPDALRLDVFLRAHPKLPFQQRVSVVRQIADALVYCHDRHVLHRDLQPGSVLVQRVGDSGDERLDVRLYNFQAGRRLGTGSPTIHTSLDAESGGLVYRAPELFEDPSRAGPASDVFSLGCLAWQVLTGRPPGRTLAERHTLMGPHGALSLAAASDDLAGGGSSAEAAPGAEPLRTLDEVVGYAACLDPTARCADVREWLEALDAALAAVPNPGAGLADPLDASAGDRLHGDIEVLGLLGTGSTARVLHVRRGGREAALKVPLSEAHDERLEREATVLARLRSERIAALHERVAVHAERRIYPCLLLDYAGTPLSRLLRERGPANLDMAARWGADLLRALETLEVEGVQHRDIKPANLGVPTSGDKRKRHLTLFDFSLSSIPAEKIEAGTPAYRDPFLQVRGAWDAAADRFGAAVTLYELLTGLRPRYGVGQDTAITSDAPITLEPERFDPGARAALTAFFERALARDAGDRYETAETMLRDWQACFAELPARAATAESEDAVAADLGHLTATTSIEHLPLGNRARNALDRAGVMTLGELLDLSPHHLTAFRGVGRETRQRIVDLVRQVREARPDLGDAPRDATPYRPDYVGPDAPVAFVDGLPARGVSHLEAAGLGRVRLVVAAPRERVARLLERTPGAAAALDAWLDHAQAEGGPDAPQTIEGWLDALLPTRGLRPTSKRRRVRQLLGLDPLPDGRHVAGVADAADALGVTRQNLYIALGSERERWRAHPALPALHDVVAGLLDGLGGAASLVVAGRDLPDRLPHRPDVTDPAVASRNAQALLRVAAESAADDAGLTLGRVHEAPWLGASADHLRAARALGRRADELAGASPLLAPAAAAEVLAAVTAGTVLEGALPERLPYLAAAASQRAAVSARLEIYPRGLAPERSILLCQGVLASRFVPRAAVCQAVRARYPEAAPLPEGDALDALVAAIGLHPAEGGAFYLRRDLQDLELSSTVAEEPRYPTVQHAAPSSAPRSERERVTRDLWDQVRLAVERGDFRALEVQASEAADLATELGRRLGVTPIALDAALLRHASAHMESRRVARAAVLTADREGPEGPHWGRLIQLAHLAASDLAAELLAQPGPLVLTRPGLLARYGLSELLTALVKASWDEGPAVLLLVPTDDRIGTTAIHGVPRSLDLPTTPGQRLRIPLNTLAKNADRGAAP